MAFVVLSSRYPPIRGWKRVDDWSGALKYNDPNDEFGKLRWKKLCALDSASSWKAAEGFQKRYAVQPLPTTPKPGEASKKSTMTSSPSSEGGDHSEEAEDKYALLQERVPSSGMEAVARGQGVLVKKGQIWTNSSEQLPDNGLCASSTKPCHIYEMVVTTDRSNPATRTGEFMSLDEGLRGTCIKNLGSNTTLCWRTVWSTCGGLLRTRREAGRVREGAC